MKHESLIARLCEASEGGAELSAEVWTALTSRAHAVSLEGYIVNTERDTTQDDFYMGEPCLTTSLSAAWEEAERRGYRPQLSRRPDAASYRYGVRLLIDRMPDDHGLLHVAHTPALALCAAILAAEGER